MRLTIKELKDMADAVHGFEWTVEPRSFVEPYKDMVKKFPWITRLDKDKQRLLLVSFWYREVKEFTPR